MVYHPFFPHGLIIWGRTPFQDTHITITPVGPAGPPEILEVALPVPSRHCATRLSRGDWPDGLQL